MKKIVRFLLSMLPVAVFIAYSGLYSMVGYGMFKSYTLVLQQIMLVISSFLVGITILLISRKTFKEAIAEVSVLLFTLLFFIIPTPQLSFFHMLLKSGFSVIVLFLGLYIGLFAIIFCRLFKMLKQQKYEKNVQPPQ